MIESYFSGETPKGFKLKMVQVFFRHGDRLRDSQIIEPESCFIDTSLFENDDILERFVRTMTKFTGKRQTGSSFNRWPLFPNKTECPAASLTGIGAAQLIRLGQYFRNKYLTPSGMFSDEIPLTSQIYTGSTLFERTYQSAIAFLFGLLEQEEFNLTKLHIDQTNVFLCFKEDIYAKKFNYPPIWYLFQQMSKIRNGYLNVTGEKFTYLGYMYVIILTYCRNRPKTCLPEKSTMCFTSNDFDMIWENFGKENKYVHEHSPDKKYFYAAYYTVMTQIVDQMTNRINNANLTKLVIRSSHDRTLITFLKVFGVNGNWIRYAGRIVLELFESDIDKIDNAPEQDINNVQYGQKHNHLNDTSSQNSKAQRPYNDSHKHYIKFFYDGEDLTESITFCKGKTFKGLCEFSLFYDFVYKEMSQIDEEMDPNDTVA